MKNGGSKGRVSMRSNMFSRENMGKACQGTLDSQSTLRILRCISTDTMAFKPFSDTIIVTLTLRHGRLHILPKISEAKNQNQSVGLLVPGMMVFCGIFSLFTLMSFI